MVSVWIFYIHEHSTLKKEVVSEVHCFSINFHLMWCAGRNPCGFRHGVEKRSVLDDNGD